MIDEEIYQLRDDYIYNNKDMQIVLKAGTVIIYKYDRDIEERTITLKDGTTIKVDDSILQYIEDITNGLSAKKSVWNNEINQLNTKSLTITNISLFSFLIAIIFCAITVGAEISHKKYMESPHYNVIDNMGNTYIDDNPFIDSYVKLDNFTLAASNGSTYTYTIIPKEELETPMSYYICIVSTIIFISALAVSICLWIIVSIMEHKINKKTKLKYAEIFDYNN